MSSIDLTAVDLNALAAELDLPLADAMNVARAVQRHTKSGLLDAVKALADTGLPVEHLAESLRVVSNYRQAYIDHHVPSNNAHVVARAMALMQSRLDPSAPSHLPRTAAEADDFFPDAWVIAAIEVSLKWAAKQSERTGLVPAEPSNSLRPAP